MRTSLPVVLTACLLLAGGQAQAQDNPRAVIEKAIKAHGGADALARFKAGRAKIKGKIELADGIPFTQEMVYQLPNQFKEVLELETAGQKVSVTTIFNGEKGSLEVNGKPQELDEKLLTELKEAGHLMRLTRLIPLLEDQSVKLSLVGEDKVNGRPAVGVRVECRGFRDVNLYFDKEKGLLVKTERRALDAMSGQEVTEERIVTEYQQVQGLQSPKKVLVNRDGKKFMEAEVIEVKFLEAVDPGTFKP
ncbi:MAG TPA: hypothetical protein VNK04_15370 [Gemmataceae bacterium]|nr:hypothetical protein [Gemmataceae bacterium]